MKSKPTETETVLGDPECVPASFLCVKVLCGAVIQADTPERLMLGEDKALSGVTHTLAHA